MQSQKMEHIGAGFLVGANTDIKARLQTIKQAVAELNPDEVPASVVFDSEKTRGVRVFCADVEALKSMLSPDVVEHIEYVQEYFRQYFDFLSRVKDTNDIEQVSAQSRTPQMTHFKTADGYILHKMLEKTTDMLGAIQVLQMPIFVGVAISSFSLLLCLNKAQNTQDMLQILAEDVVRNTPFDLPLLNTLLSKATDKKDTDIFLELLSRERGELLLNAHSLYLIARNTSRDEDLSHEEKEDEILSIVGKVTPESFEGSDEAQTKGMFVALIRERLVLTSRKPSLVERLGKIPFGRYLLQEIEKRPKTA